MHLLFFLLLWILLLAAATVVLAYVGRYLRPRAAAESRRRSQAFASESSHPALSRTLPDLPVAASF